MVTGSEPAQAGSVASRGRAKPLAVRPRLRPLRRAKPAYLGVPSTTSAHVRQLAADRTQRPSPRALSIAESGTGGRSRTLAPLGDPARVGGGVRPPPGSGSAMLRPHLSPPQVEGPLLPLRPPPVWRRRALCVPSCASEVGTGGRSRTLNLRIRSPSARPVTAAGNRLRDRWAGGPVTRAVTLGPESGPADRLPLPRRCPPRQGSGDYGPGDGAGARGCGAGAAGTVLGSAPLLGGGHPGIDGRPHEALHRGLVAALEGGHAPAVVFRLRVEFPPSSKYCRHSAQ
jgi:hypothetical protein